MSRPTIQVVGLGPSDESLMTIAARRALRDAPVARLRTRQHPAALGFGDIASYDMAYENAESFEELYEQIVDDLVALAHQSPNSRVVYGVPGSPVVAERTVELLLQRSDVVVELSPAVSVIELACTALGRDPLGGLRIVDALSSGVLYGPGPILVLQSYSAPVLAHFADRLTSKTPVTVLHHLGLEDQQIFTVAASELTRFDAADHLTSLWIDEWRTNGVGLDELIELTHTLREQCPWDQEQSHASLTRHLLEESYEVIDALETYVSNASTSRANAADPTHVIEELGDLLFQIAFHCELGSEEDAFSFLAVADAVREKLISRHPHVFGDVQVADSNDVAANWETLKLHEKDRESITDGIPLQLPALTLYSKLRRKALSLGMQIDDGEALRDQLLTLVRQIPISPLPASDAALANDNDELWSTLVSVLGDVARWCAVDLEATVRRRALQLRDDIRHFEAAKRKSLEIGPIPE
jgi:tetrapyrrole methylase family protein/MazG family protein